LRRLAELDPASGRRHLEASATALREAAGIRERNGLAEGRLASERQLRLTLDRLAEENRKAGRDAEIETR